MRKGALARIMALAVACVMATGCSASPKTLEKVTYLGVYNYGAEEVNKDNIEDFKYRFLVDGEETILKIDSGEKDADGNYDYPVQNTLKEGYDFSLTVKGDTVIAAEELPREDEVDFTPVVSGVPGERTVTNFVKTAMEPVGTTLYIYGGAWNWQDNAASVQAKSIGVPSEWVRFFQEQDENFTYWAKDNDEANEDPTTSYFPFGAYNEYYYAGADCTGFVGWALYNTFETEDGKDGYVTFACDMTKWLADMGLGDWQHEVGNPLTGDKAEIKPGRIMCINTHAYISLGTCEDGSILILHSTPALSRTGQPGGGVELSAIGNSEDCGAYKLADEYMAKYYPEWYERYPIKLADPEVYLNFEGEHTGMLIWDETGERMSDPDGVTEMTPAEVLEFIFAS